MTDSTSYSDRPVHLLGLSGSLRRGSFNTALLHAASELAPAGVTITVHDYREVPLYDADLSEEPSSVAALKAAITNADGLVIATPEYNYGIPGGLKNALDWASRPAYRSCLVGKPVALMSAAGSPVGGARAQGQLKQVLLGVLARPMAAPELAVGGADRAIVDGAVTDDAVRQRIARLVSDLVAEIRSSRGA